MADISWQETMSTTLQNPIHIARPGPAVAAERGRMEAGAQVAKAEVSVPRLIMAIAFSGSALAVTVSLLIHFSLALIAAVVGVGIAQVGGHSSGARGEYVLNQSPEIELSGLLDTPIDISSPIVADTLLPDVTTSGIMEGAGGDDRAAAGPGLGQVSEGLGGAGGGDIGDGMGIGAGGGGGGAASFFGVEARGSRFAYIVDISGSMRGEKMAALKTELGESIKAMLEHMSFVVICFQSDAVPLGDRTRWMDSTEAGKRWAIEKITALESAGGTVPWPAFDIVLGVKPAPDAIYFMTDGVFDPVVADQLAVRNTGSRKIPIHCITFVDKSAEELMRRIAAESGGTYAHVAGPK